MQEFSQYELNANGILHITGREKTLLFCFGNCGDSWFCKIVSNFLLNSWPNSFSLRLYVYPLHLIWQVWRRKLFGLVCLVISIDNWLSYCHIYICFYYTRFKYSWIEESVSVLSCPQEFNINWRNQVWTKHVTTLIIISCKMTTVSQIYQSSLAPTIL